MNNKHKIILSDHGYERLIERTQCKRRNADVYVKNVWDNGKRLESYDRKSSIFKYILNAVVRNNHTPRVSGNTLFVFDKPGKTLITCYEIPQKIIRDKGTKKIREYFVE